MLDSSLWTLSFKDRFHVFGSCFHTGFLPTVLASTNTYYSWGKETGKGESKREKWVGTEEMEKVLGYNFYYNQLILHKHKIE